MKRINSHSNELDLILFQSVSVLVCSVKGTLAMSQPCEL